MDRLLVLDDEPAIGKLVARVAVSLGMDARAVESAGDFLHELDDWNPSVVVIDLLLPEKDGVELLRELAEKKASMAIILISGVSPRVLEAANRAAREKGLEVVGTLNKPFSVADMKRLLMHAIPAGSLKPVEKTADSIDFPQAELERAIADDQIGVALQPKFECGTGRLVGFEAFARWYHPGGTVLSARSFIESFEERDLIGALSDRVFAQALEWLAAFDLSESLTLCLNVSPALLHAEDYGKRFAELCKRNAIAPGRILLELTKGSLLKQPASVVSAITGLRVYGFHVAVEDIGSRFSSLTHLADLPFSEMKIDGSFVKAASRKSEARTIVKSLIMLGHNLSMKVIAEEVEDAETDRFLAESGCDLVQGFYYGRPMPPDAAAAWLSDRLT